MNAETSAASLALAGEPSGATRRPRSFTMLATSGTRSRLITGYSPATDAPPLPHSIDTEQMDEPLRMFACA